MRRLTFFFRLVVAVAVLTAVTSGIALPASKPKPVVESRSIDVTSADAGPAQPFTYTRAAWGADESWRSYASGCNGTPDYANTVRYAVLHHTDNSNNYGPGDSASIVRGIYYFHTHTNGWCDIGYNFLV